jgi:mycothiol synthase
MTVTGTLPKNLLVRHPSMDDVRAVHELLSTCDIAEYGAPDLAEEEIRAQWNSPTQNIETDVWIVVTPENRIIGYAEVWQREHVRIFAFTRVHPDYWNQGIGNHLLHLVEERALQHIPEAPPDARVTLNHWTGSLNTEAQQVLEQEGFTRIRTHWRMQIDMQEAPTTPDWPEGITVRTFVPGQDDRRVFEMIDEAFQDHWGHMPGNFEEWQHRAVKRENFDPTLWFLAFEDDKIAGGSLCAYYMDQAWVDTLAVLRPWRRKGVGLALLLHSFGEFYRRGSRCRDSCLVPVLLGVDSQNLTGAVRLYLRAGMHVAHEDYTYMKELRAGRELSTQYIE